MLYVKYKAFSASSVYYLKEKSNCFSFQPLDIVTIYRKCYNSKNTVNLPKELKQLKSILVIDYTKILKIIPRKPKKFLKK